MTEHNYSTISYFIYENDTILIISRSIALELFLKYFLLQKIELNPNKNLMISSYKIQKTKVNIFILNKHVKCIKFIHFYYE